MKRALLAFVCLLGFSCFIQAGELSNFDDLYREMSPYLKKPISRLTQEQFEEIVSLLSREDKLCMKWIDNGRTIKDYRKKTAECLYKNTILILAVDRAKEGSSSYGNTIEKIYRAMLKEAEGNSKTIPSGVKEAIASSVFVIYAPSIAKISREKWGEKLSDSDYRNFFIREYEIFTHHKMPKDLLEKLEVR